MKKKYIIEIDDDRNIIRNCGKTMLAVSIAIGKTAGSINTGIELTPYTEPDLGKVKNDAFDDGYKCGLDDLWKAVRKIMNPLQNYKDEVFDGRTAECIFDVFTASKVIAKIKAWEKKQEELHIGDMVTFKTAYGEDTGIVVECHVPDVYSDVDKYAVWCGSKVEYIVKKGLTKTGAHFSEIASILQKIKEMKKA